MLQHICKVITVTNNKGGVGKTSTVINLGAALAKLGKKVLLIELDSQANLAISFKINTATDNNMGNVLIGEKLLPEIIVQKYGLDIAPGAFSMSAIEKELSRHKNYGFILSNLLEKHKLKQKYDFIIIDSPPSLREYTTNALCASDCFLIPFQPEYFAYQGIDNLLQYATMIKQTINPHIQFLGIVLTRYNPKVPNNIINGIVKALKAQEGIHVYKTFIRNDTTVMKAQMAGMPVLDYQYDSKSTNDYVNLTSEVLQSINY